MEHLVIKIFSDKESGKVFLPNSYFNCEDYKRIESLSSLGFIVPNVNSEKLKQVEEVKEEVKPKATRKTTTRKKAVDTDVTEG